MSRNFEDSPAEVQLTYDPLVYNTSSMETEDRASAGVDCVEYCSAIIPAFVRQNDTLELPDED